ncbi:MAG: hypothetical protein NTY88_14925 [Bacteroidetes bacterium]|nr:hypothetical protein [Bacteroidota bacterium]
MSSCSKESTTLTTLHGTWMLTSELDASGVPVLPTVGCTTEELVTFFLCKDNDQGDCKGTTKSTLNCTGFLVPIISTSYFSYAVFEKTQLVWSGSYYEIESISKKELKLHPASSPKATLTFAKQ